MGISGKWLLTAAGIALLTTAAAGCGQAAAAHNPSTRTHSVTPSSRTHSVTASSRNHHVQGRYITKAAAERRALTLAREMGPRPRIVAARLMSPSAANWATGQSGPGSFTDPAVEVWLVWVRGTWRSFSCVVVGHCGVSPHQLYYIGVDARTGVYSLTGYSRSYPRGAL